MKRTKKTRLIRFLDRRAFDPVLEVSPQQSRSASQRMKLQHVQKSAREEKARYHTRYEDAKEIRRAFFDDINARAANGVDAELKELHLPMLANLKDEFVGLCEKLDV